MSYRPYPNADRALRHLARHTPPEPPTIPALAPLGQALAQTKALVGKQWKGRITMVESPQAAIDRARDEGFAAGVRSGYTGGGGRPHRA